jgi:hypothetical protein
MSRMRAIRLMQYQLSGRHEPPAHLRRRVEHEQIRGSVSRYFVPNDGA